MLTSTHEASHEKLLTLHRYFVWAGEMHSQLLRIFMRGNDQRTVPVLRRVMKDIAKMKWPSKSKLDPLRTFLYLSYWYASLYVVIEGWNDLGLHDPSVDPLLRSPNVDLLRRYRNAVFHYQGRYYDEKFMTLMRAGQDVAAWTQTLHLAIGDAIWSRVQNTAPSRDRHYRPDSTVRSSKAARTGALWELR